MKVFLDANVLVSVLNKEYPLFTYSARLLSLADNIKYSLYTSPICLAIGYYFAEKKSGATQARKKIELLVSKLHITVVDEQTVSATSNNKSIHDFEDGLQYYSALSSGCQVIVTENIKDYYFSDIEVNTTTQFMKKHVF